MSDKKLSRVVKHKGLHYRKADGTTGFAKVGDTVMVSVETAQAFADRLVDPKVLEAEVNAVKAAAEAALDAAKSKAETKTETKTPETKTETKTETKPTTASK